MTSYSPLRRILRIGAYYDLVTTAPFATPWTASGALAGLRDLHVALGLEGTPPPSFEPAHVLFVNLLGVLVALWSIARLRRSDRETAAIDTAGRAGFGLVMALALAQDVSHAVALFLVPELTFMGAQAYFLWQTTPESGAKRQSQVRSS